MPDYSKEDMQRLSELIPEAEKDGKKRLWITPDGIKDAGGQWKDGKQVPLQETDLDKMQR